MHAYLLQKNIQYLVYVDVDVKNIHRYVKFMQEYICLDIHIFKLIYIMYKTCITYKCVPHEYNLHI